MIARREAIALGAAAAFALATPALLLFAPAPQATQPAAPARPPIAPTVQPPLAGAFDRTLFAVASAEPEAPPADAPALVGIAGRLDRDAVALVRGADGATRTLAIGASVDGWRLDSLSLDAAFFTRGNRKVRVPMPAE